MTFYTPSVATIRDNILRDIRVLIPDAVTVEGSDYWVSSTAHAQSQLPMYANAAYRALETFPDTASDIGRARFADLYRVPRLGALYASGTVTVTSSYATTIADSSVLSNTSTGIKYLTVGVTTIGAGLTATAYVIAQATGPTSNAVSGTVLTFEAPPPGVSSVATTIDIRGGDVAWSAGRWSAEIVKAIGSRPKAGNISHVLAICASVPGVEQGFVYPALKGPGTLAFCITTSYASGSRIASNALIGRVLGALQLGIRAPGGDFIPGVAEDVFENTTVVAAVAQSTNVLVAYTASAANPFDVWPPSGTGYAVPSTEATWYKVTSSTSLSALVVGLPASGTAVTPTAGTKIGLFFPSVGFVKASILAVTGSGPWTIVVGAWSTTPTETTCTVDGVVSPWCESLTLIAGPPATDTVGLTGAVPTYFASLGPGEMTPLTSDDTTRRRRFPRSTEVSPITKLTQWPTDLSNRMNAAILNTTDASDCTVTPRSGFTSTPSVPIAAYIGTPPSILTIGSIAVVPQV